MSVRLSVECFSASWHLPHHVLGLNDLAQSSRVDVIGFWSDLMLFLLSFWCSWCLQAVQKEMADLLAVASEAARSCKLLSGQEEVSVIIPGATLNGAVPCLPANGETTFTTLHHFLHALQNRGTIKGHHLSFLSPAILLCLLMCGRHLCPIDSICDVILLLEVL